MENMNLKNIGNDASANIGSGGGRRYLVDLTVSLSDVENINHKNVSSHLWFNAIDLLYIRDLSLWACPGIQKTNEVKGYKNRRDM
jgi:hypothetical protein